MNRKILINIFFLASLLLNQCKNQNEYIFKLSLEEKIYLKQHTVTQSDIKKAKTNKRKFLKIIEKYDEIDISEIPPPHYLKYYKNYIFMISGASRLIHRISISHPEHRITFGEGIGKGPGELIAYSGCVFYENKMYILDERKLTIEVYSIEGDFIRSIKLEEGSIRKLQFINDNKLIGITNKNPIKYYYVYNFKGELVKKIGGPLINKKIHSVLYHENNICQLSDSSFLQVPIRLGIFGFYKYDSLIYVKETISGFRDPKIQNKSLEGGKHMESANFNNNYFPCINVASNSELIIFQARIINNNIYKSIFDVYDKNSHNYLYSFRLDVNEDGRIRHPTLINNNLFITNQVSKLVIWKLNTD